VHHILPEILSLAQHNQTLDLNSEKFRPPNCSNCKKSGLWHHGHYDRKADYENSAEDSLNPISIPRFYCPSCKNTCSVLPECIPPRRHYPWSIQEVIFLLFVSELSFLAIEKKVKPSRWTISRWIQRFKSQFLIHADQLRSLLPSQGRINGFKDFWRSILHHHRLSNVMLNLNNSGVVIP